MKKIILWLILFMVLATKQIWATDEAVITRILEAKKNEVMEVEQLYQKIEVKITKGENVGTTMVIENGNQPMANIITFKTGDRVLVNKNDNYGDIPTYSIVDFIRFDGLLLLTILFTATILLITRGAGIGSILGMILTFGILFLFVLPQISDGRDPVLIAFLASLFIIPSTYVLSHGWNKKTLAAIIGSIIALVLTNLLSYWFIEITRLTGLSSEDAGMLAINKLGNLNMKGILLAGIMIETLGVLDDITISQSSIVSELSLTGKFKKPNELFSRAMVVGKDHISSMVNTLVLAYAGAALPLLLIFIDNPHPWSEVINYEFMAEEIVRTLIGSTGLVIAVPITTYLAARMMKSRI